MANSKKAQDPMSKEEALAKIAEQETAVIGTHAFKITGLNFSTKTMKAYLTVDIESDSKAADYNPSGVFALSPAAVNRLAERAGVPNAQALQVLLNMGSRIMPHAYIATVRDCKAGDIWYDDRNGKQGVYTKDHYRLEDEEIELNQLAQAKLVDAALGSAFSNSRISNVFGAGAGAPAPVAQQQTEDSQAAPSEDEAFGG